MNYISQTVQIVNVLKLYKMITNKIRAQSTEYWQIKYINDRQTHAEIYYNKEQVIIIVRQTIHNKHLADAWNDK